MQLCAAVFLDSWHFFFGIQEPLLGKTLWTFLKLLCADEQVFPAGAGLVCQLPLSSIAMVKTCTVGGQNLHMFGGSNRIVNEQIFTL